MAEGKVNLPEDLMQAKPGDASWSGKEGAPGGNGEDRGSLSFFDDVKDPLSSESSIPLSPQWLYAKPIDWAVIPTAPGDSRSSSSLAHGSSNDNVLKDRWRLDGSQDKKEWQRGPSDTEISNRWRDEERETSLLGRRERRKDGDRETDYRKSDRQADTTAMRETSDAKPVPQSERWHEAAGRNTSHENHRDSKWTSRWGPEDKEDPRNDKKVEANKEDSHTEKLSTSNSESRDKWRPRHRVESHSGGSAVHRAAPGFGSEKGRTEGGVSTGFAPGRGRSSSTRTQTIGRPAVSSIGFAPANKTEMLGSGAFPFAYRYPRGKLLDICRNHTFSTTDVLRQPLDQAPHITSSFTKPLAFISPDGEEEDILDGISKEKITDSEVSYPVKSCNNTLDDDNMEGDNMNLDAKKQISTANPEVCKPTNHQWGSLEVGKEKLTILPDGTPIQRDEIFTYSRNGGNLDVTAPSSDDYKIDDKTSSNIEGISWRSDEGPSISAFPSDVCDVLPDDSSSLLEVPSLQTDSVADETCPKITGDANFLDGVGPFEELSLFYRDPHGVTQGPFLGVDIMSGFEHGFFGMDLPVLLADAPTGTPFQQLREMMPHLKLKAQSSNYSIPYEKVELLNDGVVNLDADEVLSLGALDDQGTAPTKFVGVPDIHDQLKASNLLDDIGNSNFTNLPHSSLDITSPSFNQKQSNPDPSAFEIEEVLYEGRPLRSWTQSFDRPACLEQVQSEHPGLSGEPLRTNMSEGKIVFKKTSMLTSFLATKQSPPAITQTRSEKESIKYMEVDSSTKTSSKYIQKSYDEVLILENEDLSKEIEYIINKYFPEGYNHIPTLPGKNQIYYEKILLETGSVKVFHNYKDKSIKKNLQFSQLKIQKIITLSEWNKEGNPNIPKRFKTFYQPQYYNYWDYQNAWENIIYVQNTIMSHTWSVKWSLQTKLPNWFFYKFWQNFGAIKEILPTILKKNIMGNDLIEEDRNMMKYISYHGIPWIIQWEWEKDIIGFPPTLDRQIYVKWWDKFNIDHILKGKLIPILHSGSQHNSETKTIGMFSFSQLKQELTRKIQLENLNIEDNKLQLMVFEEMSKVMDENSPDDSNKYEIEEDGKQETNDKIVTGQ